MGNPWRPSQGDQDLDVDHSWSELLEEAARQMSLSCQPQVLHTVSGNYIPARAKASLEVLLHLSHLLLWARLQLLMG